MTYGSVADVAAELARPTPTDPGTVAQWSRWIERVENIIRSRIPDLDERIAAGMLAAQLVADIEAAAVARLALNPEGLRQVTKAVDDGSVTKLVDASRSTGQLLLTPEEWALLVPQADGGAFSTRPRFDPDTVAVPEPWT